MDPVHSSASGRRLITHEELQLVLQHREIAALEARQQAEKYYANQIADLHQVHAAEMRGLEANLTARFTAELQQVQDGFRIQLQQQQRQADEVITGPTGCSASFAETICGWSRVGGLFKLLEYRNLKEKP